MEAFAPLTSEENGGDSRLVFTRNAKALCRSAIRGSSTFVCGGFALAMVLRIASAGPDASAHRPVESAPGSKLAQTPATLWKILSFAEPRAALDAAPSRHSHTALLESFGEKNDSEEEDPLSLHGLAPRPVVDGNQAQGAVSWLAEVPAKSSRFRACLNRGPPKL